MKRSGEKKTKKRHDCISSRKFFWSPNKKNKQVFFSRSEDSMYIQKGFTFIRYVMKTN